MQARHDSAFTPAVQSVTGLLHQTIPPSAHTWQADVETAHRLIADEFYEVESFSSRSDFLAKATTYHLWFNTLRKNSYKQHRSPWEIVHTRDPSLPKRILTLPPVFLDQLHNQTLELPAPGGYDLYSVSLKAGVRCQVFGVRIRAAPALSEVEGTVRERALSWRKHERDWTAC